MSFSIFVASAPGLETLLAAELSGLGIGDPRIKPGGVECEGGLDDLVRLNLWSGLGTHVLVRVGSFKARRFDAFVRKATRLPWAELLRRDVPITVKATCKRSKLYHSGAVEERVHKAVEASLGRAPDGDGPPVTVLARIVDDVCTLSIDTSGEPLHRRGWRLQTGKAPLREDLARALVVVSGWTPGELLVDPLMGSGTIAIEAATIAMNLAPGRLRPFALEHTALDVAGLLKTARDEARSSVRPPVEPLILARDHMSGALGAAQGNAERAEVLPALRLEQADLSVAWPEAPRGVVCTNPPYGRRVEPGADLDRLYTILGERVRAAGPDWSLCLVTDDRRHLRSIGVPLRSALTTAHGGLKVDFMRSRA